MTLSNKVIDIINTNIKLHGYNRLGTCAPITELAHSICQLMGIKSRIQAGGILCKFGNGDGDFMVCEPGRLDSDGLPDFAIQYHTWLKVGSEIYDFSRQFLPLALNEGEVFGAKTSPHVKKTEIFKTRLKCLDFENDKLGYFYDLDNELTKKISSEMTVDNGPLGKQKISYVKPQQ